MLFLASLWSVFPLAEVGGRRQNACGDYCWQATRSASMDDTKANEPLLDSDLQARSACGQRKEFGQLAERYYRPICGFLFKRLQRTDVVEDLAQETFLEAYRSLKGGSRPTHFSSWLFGIAVNCCGKWLRRQRPALFPADDPPEVVVNAPVSAVEELEEQRHLQSQLDDGLASLPAETRRLLDMKHQRGLTCEQIAGELGQPVGTIKSQLSRAYKALRARITRGREEMP